LVVIQHHNIFFVAKEFRETKRARLYKKYVSLLHIQILIDRQAIPFHAIHEDSHVFIARPTNPSSTNATACSTDPHSQWSHHVERTHDCAYSQHPSWMQLLRKTLGGLFGRPGAPVFFFPLRIV